MSLIPLLSSIVSFVFAIVVLDQFLAHRRPYQLIWSIGLAMYGISTAMEFISGTWGISDAVYRLWYLFGAILVAAYLGMGTLYLLLKPRAANILMGLLFAASIFAAFKVFTASVAITGLESLTGTGMPDDVRLMTPFFNIFGTLALVGGALYSAWFFWRHRVKKHRVLSNVLIARSNEVFGITRFPLIHGFSRTECRK